MPNIPSSSIIGYLGVFFLLVGVFFLLTDFGLIKIQNITITSERKPWAIGLIMGVSGALLIIAELIYMPQGTIPSSPSQTATIAITPSPKITHSETFTLSPTSTVTDGMKRTRWRSSLMSLDGLSSHIPAD